MSAYTYYEAIRKEYTDYEETHLSDKELAALINNCQSIFRANCGELRRLSRRKALGAYRSFLSKGKNAVVTCGKYIYADNSGKNPNIAMAEQYNYFGNNAIYHYIPYTPLEQIAYGFLHAFIFDNKTVFIEKPHGYAYDIKGKDFVHGEGILYRNNEEVATLIEEWTQAYDDEFSVKGNFREEMYETIRRANDSVWQDPINCFNTEDEFTEFALQSIKNAKAIDTEVA